MDFSDIVERSRALRSIQEASASKMTDSIPRLERALPQIDYESRRVMSDSTIGATHSHHQQERALRLLSEYGYETDKIERTLQSVALLDSAFEPLQSTPDTDIQSYLDSGNELTVAATFDAAVRRARTRSLTSLACSIDTEWDVSKRDLLSSSSSTTPAAGAIDQHRQQVAPHNRASQRLSSSHVFASPFRQPRSSRLSSAFDPAAPMSARLQQPQQQQQYGATPTRTPRSTLRGGRLSLGRGGMDGGVGGGGGMASGRLESHATMEGHPSIYYDIVRSVVFSGYRPRPLDASGFDADHANVSNLSAVSAVRVATEFDDILLEHFAPRGDATAAPKSVQHLHAVFNALRYIVGEDKMGKRTSKSNHNNTRDNATGMMMTGTAGNGVGQELVISTPRQQHRHNQHAATGGAPGQAKCGLVSHIARGAQRFLCLQFREDKMRREMETRPVEARRGGIPGVRADVRAYLNLVFDRGVPSDQLGPLYDDMPIWAFIYYLLRAGFDTDAYQLVQDALSHGCTSAPLTLFRDALESYIENDRNIADDILHSLVQEYGVSVKRGTDPYMRAVYVVIARLDPAAGDKMALLDSDYALLFYSIEDYLWLRLSVARVDGVDHKLPTALAAYALSVRDIGREIIRFGPGHFNPNGESPMFYALVLLLCGQFKEAVTYLDEKARNITEAMHVAFVLYHYGLISDHQQHTTSTTTVNNKSRQLGDVDGGHDDDGGSLASQMRVDYAGLVWKYASRMCSSDACAAATYIFSVDDTAMRTQLTKKLILHASGSQQYDALLGRHGDGGILAQLWTRKSNIDMIDGNNNYGIVTTSALLSSSNNTNDSWKSVVVQAGDEAERKGERDTALRLYEIAGVNHKIMSIHIARVSAEVCNVPTTLGYTTPHQHNRQAIISSAHAFLQHLRASASGIEDVGDRALRCLHTLLTMTSVFDLKAEQRFTAALHVLQRELDILPREDGQVVAKSAELSYSSSGDGSWCDQVIDRVPELIVAAVEIIAAVLTDAGDRREDERVIDDEERQGLRKWARCLVNLAGMMRNVSADMSARLVNLEVVIN